MSGPEMATRVALLLGGGPAVALFAVGSFVARLNRHRRSRKEFVEEPDFSYYRSPVAARLVVKGERVALRLVVDTKYSEPPAKQQEAAQPQPQLPAGEITAAEEPAAAETTAAAESAAAAAGADDAEAAAPDGSAPPPRRQQPLHVTISSQLPTQERKRPKEVIDVLREVMRQKRKQERLRRLRDEHRGLVGAPVPEGGPLLEAPDTAGGGAGGDTDQAARRVEGDSGEAAGPSSARSGGGADAGGSDARRSSSRGKWRDLVAQLEGLKASNRAAEGEVSTVLEKMFTMNAELMGCWHQEMAEQMANMSGKMEDLAEENLRLREEVASLKGGGSTPTNGSELSTFKDRLARHPRQQGSRGPGGAYSACSDASSLRSSVMAPPSQGGGGGGSFWGRGWGRSARRAYSTADAYSLPPTPGGSLAGVPTGAASTVSAAAGRHAYYNGGGRLPPSGPVDVEALFDSFGTGSVRGGGGGGGRGGASDVTMLSPRSMLTDV